MYADGSNTIKEQYEQSNFMFFTRADKKPLSITNVDINGSNQKSCLLTKGVFPGELKKSQPNAYRIDEIAALVQHQKEAGILELKMHEYKNAPKIAGASKGRSYTGRKIIEARLNR